MLIRSFSKDHVMDTQVGDNWYLLQCRSQQQQRAELHLHNQGFRLFSPSHEVQRNCRGKMQLVREPLFPGYLFVYLRRGSNWPTIRSTRGVQKIVGFGGSPTPVSQRIIQFLRQRCLQESVPKSLFSAGDRVMVTDGCFRHMEAIVKTARPGDRVILLMNLMHREQAVEVPVTSVMAI